MLRPLILLACLSIGTLSAKEVIPSSGVVSHEIFGHGTIRATECAFEAVVEVAANLVGNIQTGQQVWMDVRQGQLHGTVKAVHSSTEITIALDAPKSKVKLSRLHPGQAVIALFQLDTQMN
jgi:hypothetical protein